MTATQRIIKYCAVAFAVLLIVSIIGGIVQALYGLTYFFGDEEVAGEMKSYDISGDIDSLEIDLKGAQLEIKNGKGFSVESNYNNLKVKIDDGQLTLKGERVWLNNKGAVKVVLTVPEGVAFETASISTGAGKVEIDTLSADKLTFDLGAGEVSINELTANKQARISGGAGEVEIKGGELADLKFDMGVGEVSLRSRLSGSSDIDCGVGELNLTLIGDARDYSVSIDKGVGQATLDGMTMEDGVIYGDGESTVEIDGGVGAVAIELEAQAVK